MTKNTDKATTTDTWTDQARNAIRQGQSLNDFVSHCHIDNRRQARKAFLSARLAIIPNEQERQELMASVNHADKLAEALRILNGCAERGLDQSATHDGLSNCKAIADAREALAAFEAAQ